MYARRRGRRQFRPRLYYPTGAGLIEPLQRLVEEIAGAPHSAAALTLYALVSTLEFERAGYLFKLAKLRDLSVEQRRLAYDLIELMALGKNTGPDWEAAKLRMDELVRAG